MAKIPSTELELPSGEIVEIEMIEQTSGIFEGTLPGAERGLYRARSGDLFAAGEVGLAAPQEFQDILMERRILTDLSVTTNGGAFTLRTGGEAILPAETEGSRSATNRPIIKMPAIRRTGERAVRQAGNDWIGIPRRDASRIDAVILKQLAPPIVWLLLIGIALLGAWSVESGRRPKASQ